MKKKNNILVSGSLVYDRIMDFPGYFKDYIMPEKAHILNVSFAVNGLTESFGGTAGNIAYNLSLLGLRPVILATAGRDFGIYKKWLAKNRIDISRIKIIKNKNTASCYITTDKADNQITAFNPGALESISSVNNISRFYRSAPLRSRMTLAIISPGNNKDMENYARVYKKNKIFYIYDPGQQITSLKKSSLLAGIAGASALVGNDYEFDLIKKITGWTAKKILDKVSILIITKGKKGAEIYDKNKIFKIPAVKLKKIVDPTGAGDAFRAGLIAGLANNMGLKEIGRLANTVASYAVEKRGTQAHRFGWKDVRRRYRESYGEKLFYK
ncbi:carbohydrate kinase family protein [Candidatus Falkowbacteria bacterium CG_4_9_14_3_um_filter_36_9]|uniref:Carbohydrate kinase PfkB domain-containing protein n=2 Tax=Candidatus Falkowiibacteriota TaxID=1752728 RepID=A0A1J4TA43_9BACT|nr:MAG: hypothetical protein AUJ27_02615 [Candidatus Falkowbacteria bacterium CG1_02_37_44]PIV50424.1 MAG: carbohydrate kinase family protein [Candidatus Falkowbacteria bacterium CG02_land_8_20_14_3_00_36_14]PIX11864.1 MAG: carbohydrate kinase family protein [Candidatus Falkowbacteria bacterium CG_4_8_14_3_um_filter_36_11]PJA11300.1 MAG: carbohydrate kinase family protein [Candidatus Falkowbacteria bacterium CG_4_10_14_0_2_um_filter_36_22]PJB18703.1 MAG: carbohydrate kinase family protein [Cand